MKERKPTDRCARKHCRDTRAEHIPKQPYTSTVRDQKRMAIDYTHVATLGVTGCQQLCTCVAFIEPGEKPNRLGESLPPRSQEFFDERWRALHGDKTRAQVLEIDGMRVSQVNKLRKEKDGAPIYRRKSQVNQGSRDKRL